jgi:hypothetical protein
MIGFTILSHNIQGKFSLFEEELNRFIGERPLNVACLQDVGYIGPDGPIAWKDHANTDQSSQITLIPTKAGMSLSW